MTRYVLILACPILIAALLLLTGSLQNPAPPQTTYGPVPSFDAIFGQH